MTHSPRRRSLRWLGAAALMSLPLLVTAASQFGAIAFNKVTLSYGYAFNHPTRVAAENRAIQECGGGCATAVWFANGCGSIAIGETQRYAMGSAPDRIGARNLALERCGKGCRSLVTTCTELPRKAE
jgi:hypothetical protein